jgi:hypothetical protein
LDATVFYHELPKLALNLLQTAKICTTKIKKKCDSLERHREHWQLGEWSPKHEQFANFIRGYAMVKILIGFGDL